MRQDQSHKPTKIFDRSLLEHSPRANPARSGVIVPRQIHRLLIAHQGSARRTDGAAIDLGIEIAENLGPIPRDYANLLIVILRECVRYIGGRSNGSPSVEVRLSEVQRHAQLSFVVLGVGNRGSERAVARRLSEELLRLRGCTEQLNGSLVIDEACHDKTVFRVALPIILLCD